MLFDYFQQNFQIFLTIFVRILGLFLLMPVLSPNVPAMARAGLSFLISLVAAPIVINIPGMTSPDNLMDFAIVLLSSFLVGISIGFVIQITVSAIHLSSTIFSTTMGLSLSETLDPGTQTSIPSLGNLLSVLITLLFIRTESHIVFTEMIIRSFYELPIVTTQSNLGMLMAMKTSSAVIFSVALRISAPIIALTLLLDIAMGIIGRVAPQFNVMLMGWNIKLLIGFGMLWLILPSVLDYGTVFFKELHDTVLKFLSIAKQGVS